MSDMDRGPKSYELLEETEVEGLTIPAGHYSGVAGWSGKLENGQVTRGPTSHSIHLTPAQVEEMGGRSNGDGSPTVVDVTHLIREGIMR